VRIITRAIAVESDLRAVEGYEPRSAEGAGAPDEQQCAVAHALCGVGQVQHELTQELRPSVRQMPEVPHP
jgi:hypothetical protein